MKKFQSQILKPIVGVIIVAAICAALWMSIASPKFNAHSASYAGSGKAGASSGGSVQANSESFGGL